MATKLSDLAARAMDVGANTGVSSKINTWVNWAIQEIWEDSLWNFRVREAAVSLAIAAGDFQKTLAADFSKPKEFRVITSGSEGKMHPISKELLVLASPNWKDNAVDKRGTPRLWIDPIMYSSSGAVKTLQFWPPADQAYTIDYDYYSEHPELGSNDLCQIPSRHDRVIIERTLVYIRSSEDEADLRPWEQRYVNSLKHMRMIEKRSPGVLPGWKHELQLINVHRALTGLGNDVDIR